MLRDTQRQASVLLLRIPAHRGLSMGLTHESYVDRVGSVKGISIVGGVIPRSGGQEPAS